MTSTVDIWTLQETKVKDTPIPIYVDVTPKLADQLLHGNKVNRNMRPGVVDKYVRDMIAGDWGFSESAVCFDKGGLLLNGQHRLTAVARSGCTITMLFLYNMDQSQMAIMDIGSSRTAKDVFGFDGEKNASLLASTARVALNFERGDYHTKNYLSVSEMRKFVEENADIRDSVEVACRWQRHLDTTGTAMAIAHWMIIRAGVPKVYADKYLEKLGTRAGEPLNSPILAVDSRFREMRRTKTSLPIRNHVYLLLKGWNYWATGKSAAKISSINKGDHEFKIPAIAKFTRKDLDFVVTASHVLEVNPESDQWAK